MRWNLVTGSVATAALLGLILTAPVAAQTPQTEGVSDKELENFAEAYLDVQEIRQHMETRLGTVEDPGEAQAIQERYNEQMVTTIEDHGFTPKEYEGVVAKINESDELREQFFTLVEQLREEEQSDE